MRKLEAVDALVIGSGPGGYEAARRCAQLGMKTSIVERAQLGGVCTHVGCIPSKALIAEAHRYASSRHWGQIEGSAFFSNAQAFKQGVVTKQAGGVRYLLNAAGVQILEGEAGFIDEHTAAVKQTGTDRVISFKHAILATGSRPIQLPALPFGGRILSSSEALSLSHIPTRLVVIGGGYIGVELGQMYANFGTKVTMLEAGERVLPGFEAELAAPVIRQLQADGITILTEATAVKAEQTADGLTLHYLKNGELHRIDAEHVLVTVGRKPNTDGSLGLERIKLPLTSKGQLETDGQCRTAIPHIFAIGDVAKGPSLAHKASYEAKVAAEAIAGKPSAVDYKAIPLVVFSEPELASVGLGEADARAAAIPVVIGKSSFGINGRALALQAPEGFVKLIADPSSGIVRERKS